MQAEGFFNFGNNGNQLKFFCLETENELPIYTCRCKLLNFKNLNSQKLVKPTRSLTKINGMPEVQYSLQTKIFIDSSAVLFKILI